MAKPAGRCCSYMQAAGRSASDALARTCALYTECRSEETDHIAASPDTSITATRTYAIRSISEQAEGRGVYASPEYPRMYKYELIAAESGHFGWAFCCWAVCYMC